jgi:hypothetical protein
MNLALTRRIPIAAAALVAGIVVATPAGAQTRATSRDVCVSVDEAHDTLAPQERAAARLLVARQFELEGWHVVPDGCAALYTVAHLRLGRTIVVTLAGPAGRRDGTALGLDDLPALYSQMVRSIVTGRPMTGMSVIDRTNVTAAQAMPPPLVASDSFGYGRLGAGRAGPSVGLGRRVETTSAVAVDVSFLNFQTGWTNGASNYSSNGRGSSTSWSWIKLEGLHFKDPSANASAYVGGGISWGGAYSWEGKNWTNWRGTGLQGELTAGYEIGRASTLRMFVQVDATLPFYSMVSSSTTGAGYTSGRRYSPSLIVSVGVGWHRERR